MIYKRDSAEAESTKTEEKKRKDPKQVILTVLIFVFLGVFLFSGYKILSWYINSRKDMAVNQELRNEIVVTYDDNGNEVQDLSPYEKYQILFEANEDMAGWIKIDGTHIDYPVMNTQYYPEKYLRTNFHGEYALGGTLFVGAGCSLDPRSDNVVIYGHNMTDDTMFHDLVLFSDPAFLAEHPYIQFDTDKEYGVYEIIYVIKTQVYTESDWEYYAFIDAANADEFYRFIQGCKQHSIYNTGKEALYGDELLTLSTCEYSVEDGRMVIVAKKISSSN